MFEVEVTNLDEQLLEMRVQHTPCQRLIFRMQVRTGGPDYPEDLAEYLAKLAVIQAANHLRVTAEA